MTDIHIYKSKADLITAAADRIVEAATANHDCFTLALAGGSTPLPVYEKLATSPYAGRVNWAKTHIFFSDERAVPPTHDDSNYNAAQSALLAHVPIPLENVHRMRGELGAEEAAKDYGLMLQAFFDGGPPTFDVSLLGMGDDGHTASLFPHSPALDEAKHRVVATGDNRHRHPRITMTAWALNAAKHTLILVAGDNKAATLREVLEGSHAPQLYPVQLIQPTDGTLTWLVDEAAAARLTRKV